MVRKRQVAIVTGGARGIGRSIVEKICSNGGAVAIVDVEKELTAKTTRELTDSGYEVLGIPADVTKVSDIKGIVDRVVNELGELDILVNNAGIQIRRPSVEFPEADWDKLMNLNLKAVFFWCQEAARRMKETGKGVIVNISSGNSKMMMPERAPYCISKAGVNALTSVLGIEWASAGIRVNAVAPGWIKTEMVKEGMRLGIVKEEQVLSVTPIGRLATMEEIADAVFFLLNDDSRYITGQTIFVDGGWSGVGLPDMKYFSN